MCNPTVIRTPPPPDQWLIHCRRGSMEEEGDGEGGAGSDWGRAYVVPDVPMICPILERGMCTSTHG